MRFGCVIYHAKRVYNENANIATFEKPKSYVTRANYISVMNASNRGYLEMMKYGEELNNTWVVVANFKAFGGVFKEGDLMWVDGATPILEIEREYGHGASANAVVRSVSELPQTISIVITKNKEQITE